MHSKKSKMLLLLLAICLIASLTACTNTQNATESTPAETTTTEENNTTEETSVKEGGTLVVSIAKAPETFNPNAKVNDLAKPVLHNVFNQLVKINGNDQVVADIAKSWDFSADGKVLTFHLQENVKWHDGEAFTSNDVKWTFDQIISEKGLASDSLANVTSIECPDENTVVFNLAEADVTILGTLAWNGTFIMPEHIYKDTDWLTNPANDAPIGTGPFKFVSYENHQTITMEKNAEYWGEVPHLDKVVLTVNEDDNTAFQAWQNGEIDEIDNSVPFTELEALQNDPNYNVYTKMWPNRGYICFQTKTGPFADLKVRQAVVYAIDLDEVFAKGYKGIGMKAEYFISPLYDWALDTDVKIPARDVDKANALLDEAGFPADENGMRFETTIDTFGGFDDQLAVIQANLKEIGIDLKINTLDDPAYDEKVWFGHNFDLTILGGYQGPDISAMSVRFQTGAGVNLGEYSNERLDELFTTGAITSNMEERAKIYKEVQKILSEDLPVAFLAEKGALIPTKAYVMNHPRSAEFVDTCTGYDYSHIWLNK